MATYSRTTPREAARHPEAGTRHDRALALADGAGRADADARVVSAAGATAPGAALHGRYMSNQLEHEYAALADQLDALEHDIRHARKVSRVAQRPPARTRAASPEPHGEPVVLPDGARVLVRPIEPADGPQLRAGFDRLDAGSRYQRFLAPIDYLSQRQLDYLTRIDHESHEALVALDAATGDGVGIARFVRDASDPTRADVAIVIADRWHGRGVGTLLANRLAARARAVGVTSFTARMLAGNRAGRRLVERVGQEIRQREDGGAIVLTAQAREHTQPAPEPPARAAPRRSPTHLSSSGCADHHGSSDAVPRGGHRAFSDSSRRTAAGYSL